jgi:hypothetical protein
MVKISLMTGPLFASDLSFTMQPRRPPGNGRATRLQPPGCRQGARGLVVAIDTIENAIFYISIFGELICGILRSPWYFPSLYFYIIDIIELLHL